MGLYAIVKNNYVLRLVEYSGVEGCSKIKLFAPNSDTVVDISDLNYSVYPGYSKFGEVFMPPKPHASWIADIEKGMWQPPINFPIDGKPYSWDEDGLCWKVASFAA